MWRLMHAAAIAALIGSAAYVYGVKYRTIYASEQLVKTRHLIAKEKDAINLLRAEYAHLARPDRLQALADSRFAVRCSEPLWRPLSGDSRRCHAHHVARLRDFAR